MQQHSSLDLALQAFYLRALLTPSASCCRYAVASDAPRAVAAPEPGSDAAGDEQPDVPHLSGGASTHTPHLLPHRSILPDTYLLHRHALCLATPLRILDGVAISWDNALATTIPPAF